MAEEMNEVMRVNFAGVEFKNPVVLASGTAGFGREYERFYDLERLGGLATKGLTLESRAGNRGIRIWETPAGIINSIGLENPGISRFIKEELPYLRELNLVSIVNIGGSTEDDYRRAVSMISSYDPDLIELNISCPNLHEGGMAFGVEAETAGRITEIIRQETEHPLLVKLSPQARDIAEVAVACEEAGAEGLSLVNTFQAMAVDIGKKKPVFANGYAGLSGPAIKPIALRMVHQVCQSVQIPVIGIGGITTWQDALEFMMVGASLIQIGTANFSNPRAGIEIVEGLEQYAVEENLASIQEIQGIL